MLEAGIYHTLRTVKAVDFGWYLDGGDAGEILLPKRFAPEDLKAGDELEVFIYHDSDNRLIATTQRPKGIVGDVVALEAVGKTGQGAFLDWGLMKDIFLPLSQQVSRIYEGGKYLVRIYRDEQTGRVAATERFGGAFTNEPLTVQEGEAVELTVWAPTDLGYRVIVNNRHTGLLYSGDVHEALEPGEKLQGYIRTVRPDGKLDVAPGIRGHGRVTVGTDRILEALADAGGYLPYNDKTPPEVISQVFGMSKKVFKMAVGALYRERKIELTQTGIKQVDPA